MPVKVRLHLLRTAEAPGWRRRPAAELRTAAAAAGAAMGHCIDRAARRTAAAVGIAGRWKGILRADPAPHGLTSGDQCGCSCRRMLVWLSTCCRPHVRAAASVPNMLPQTNGFRL